MLKSTVARVFTIIGDDQRHAKLIGQMSGDDGIAFLRVRRMIIHAIQYKLSTLFEPSNFTIDFQDIHIGEIRIYSKTNH
jgi:hypothetical protein